MPISITAPQMGESVPEGTIGKWHKQVGDEVQRDDILVEIQTDKVTVEVPSAFKGKLGKILVEEGDVVKVGQEMAILLKDGESEDDLNAEAETVKAEAKEKQEATGKSAGKRSSTDNGDDQPNRIRTSPAVRRLAREHDIDLNDVKATGPKGRIRKADIEAYLSKARPGRRAAETRKAERETTAKPSAPTRSIPVTTISREEKVERKPLEGVRKIIAEHMVKSKRTSPHVMTMDEVDMTAIVEFRKKHKERIREQYGVNLTYMPFFVKAVTSALKLYPTVNASITDDEIVIKKFYHIGIAVARDEGLIVPVIKHADTKSILELAAEVTDLAERARSESLDPEDIANGTFTLTNAGMFGALASTPVISQPQVAIMGIHAIQKRPVVRNDEIVARDMMYLTVSFDHRLIDGHTAVQFLRQVCENLEDPANMLLV